MRVCVVMECLRANRYERNLFGVYATEDLARKGYGDEDERYVPEFLMLTVVER